MGTVSFIFTETKTENQILNRKFHYLKFSMLQFYEFPFRVGCDETKNFLVQFARFRKNFRTINFGTFRMAISSSARISNSSRKLAPTTRLKIVADFTTNLRSFHKKP